MTAKLLALVLFVLELAATGAARADVPMSGTFVANSACPAVSSIRKGTNPGDVTLEPQKSYTLISGNKTPPTHYLLQIPGATPDRRWVEIGCGTTDTAAAGNGGATQAPGTGKATQYVLAISWEPGFCATSGMGSKPECQAETPSGFDASHFTLHGLWPNPEAQYSYCGNGATYKAADKPGNWDHLPPVSVALLTRPRLDKEMPGTRSLLERHEWIKHGTCSGVGMDAYFSRALDLLDDINGSAVRTLVAGKVGQQVTLAELRSAFDQAYGPGAGQRIRLSCDGHGSSRIVTEITVGLVGDVMGSTAIGNLIAASKPTGGGCDSGLIQALN
ncbi:MAG: ribonuclease [Devosia sp.]|nr:ribonuclease [Devosia sp.]